MRAELPIVIACSGCSEVGQLANQRIVAEAARLLSPGGRYGIHELCVVPEDEDVVPEDIDEATLATIQQDLSGEIHVGVRPLSTV